MAGFLPSAQFIRVVGALAIVVGGITLAYYFSSTPSEVAQTQSGESAGSLVPVSNPLLQQAADIDTDKDGLRDWEERLWKTNVLVADSDGDGTNDKNEIDTNRNPLVKGPRDQKKDTVDLLASLNPESLEDLSTTDRVAREFFVEYLSHKKGGKSLTESEVKKVIGNAVVNSISKNTPNQYNTRDVSVTSDTIEDLRAYGNALGEIHDSYPFVQIDERLLLVKYMESGSSADMAALETNTKGYISLANKLLSLAVPMRFAKLHADHLNALNHVAITVAQLTNHSKDPMLALSAVSQYEERAIDLLMTIQNIQRKLTSEGIFYKKDEAGSLFMTLGTNTPS